jgi:hypothetical protein
MLLVLSRTVGAVDELFENAVIVPEVHGNDDLGLQLFYHFLCAVRAYGENASNGLQEYIHMADQLQLIFIERFTHIP